MDKFSQKTNILEGMIKVLIFFVVIHIFGANTRAQTAQNEKFNTINEIKDQASQTKSLIQFDNKIVSVSFKGDDIFSVYRGSYQSNATENKFTGGDMYHEFPKVDDEWSYHKNDPDPAFGVHSIRIAQRNEVENYDRQFHSINENNVSKIYEFEIQPRASNAEKIDIFTAFWNSNRVPDNELKRLMTAGHHAGPNYEPLKKIVDYGHKLIPTIGGFKPDETEFEMRRRIGWYKDTFERIGWENIEYIILRDEPYLKGFTKKQLEAIVDEAQKKYEASVTYTFTRGSILREELPSNLKTVGINFYPLLQKDAREGYAQIWDYEAFRNHMDNVLSKAREKVPDAEFVLTAQVFGSKEGDQPPWRMPEPESAQWYLKAIAENPDVIGLTFWDWGAGKWIGLETNPELQQAWIEALKKYTVD